MDKKYILVYVLALVLILAGLYKSVATKNKDIVSDTAATSTAPAAKAAAPKSWRGLGFEPGFYYEISELSTQDGYATKVQFQEGGYVYGNLEKTADTDGVVVYEGLLLLGGDGNVPTKIEITKAVCTKPSGDVVGYTTKLTFGTDTYTGCAEYVI